MLAKKEEEKSIIEWEDGDENDWDFCMESLTQAISEKNPKGNWVVEVENFGWMNRNGIKCFNATTGQQIISKILPKCDCHFKVFDDGEGFKIQNWHHDSPMGNEWYYLRLFDPKELSDHNLYQLVLIPEDNNMPKETRQLLKEIKAEFDSRKNMKLVPIMG